MNQGEIWPENTTLIVGDTVIKGIVEKRITSHDFPVKVRSFAGARVSDFYFCMAPLLSKKPSNVIIHVGSNDVEHSYADKIADEIVALKAYVVEKLPSSEIVVSFPTVRDDSRVASSEVRVLRECLSVEFSMIDDQVITNKNIDSNHLGKDKLHLNRKGCDRLMKNYKCFIQERTNSQTNNHAFNRSLPSYNTKWRSSISEEGSSSGLSDSESRYSSSASGLSWKSLCPEFTDFEYTELAPKFQ